MPPRLERRQNTGNFHFLTFICHNRLSLLATPEAKNTFLAVLEQTRQRHTLKIDGYVLMPEHVHLLTDEPPNLATILVLPANALKQTTSRSLKPRTTLLSASPPPRLQPPNQSHTPDGFPVLGPDLTPVSAVL